jgi:uncharacterized protein YneF (UPF0154 family)
MDIRFSIYPYFLFACSAGIWIVSEAILTADDQRPPENEKMRRTMWSRTGLESGEMSRAWKAHQRFIPDSLLRLSI